jgi:septal ring factor EnvC (AmiA/AmiB activator)
MNDTPTPRTDANVKRHNLCQLSGNNLVYADFPRQLERELNAARAEIEKLNEQLNQHKQSLASTDIHNNQIAVKLEQVTEQRDGLQSDIDYASDQLHKVTEQIESNHKSYERIIYDVREQRDRLAEVLDLIVSEADRPISLRSCSPAYRAKQAL